MKVIGYCRTSHQRQGFSLEHQRADITAWCTEQGHELVRLVVEEKSGGTLRRRPVLRATLEAVARGEADAIVVRTGDRIARSLRDLLAITAGVRVIAIDGSIDQRSAEGRFMTSVMGAVAEFERELIGTRIREVKKFQADAGAYLGGRLPYGYRIDADGKLVPCGRERRTLALMVRLHREGLTWRQIAERLDALGVRTRYFKPFHPHSVRRIVEREER